MRAHPLTRRVVWILLAGCSPQDSATRPDSPRLATAADHSRDSTAACFVANRSVLAREPGSAGAPAASIEGWMRLDQFDRDSAGARLIDSDGFALDGVWWRKDDSLVVSGFNDFVRIEMHLRATDSAGRGVLQARSDAVLERDSTGTLREFSRMNDIRFRRAPCDSIPRQVGAPAIDAVPNGTPRPGRRFDPSRTRVGTRVGMLVVDSIVVRRAAVESTYVGTARFRGTVELSGWTVRHPDPDAYHIVTCFEADSASGARLPRWQGDERRAWFCFSNRAAAARALGPPSEGVPATIVIDQFTIQRGLSDEVNSARFLRRVRH